MTKQLEGWLMTDCGLVEFVDGKIDLIDRVPFEAFTKRTQRMVIRAVANKLIEEARQ